MTLIFASDHAGFELKKIIMGTISKNVRIIDVGSKSKKQDDDYPVYATLGVQELKKHKNALGIFVCGSGVGMAMAANRHKGIRAANVESKNAAVRSRREDNANVLVLGSRLMSKNDALSIVRAWLNAKFTNAARHRRRLAMFS